MRCVVTNCAVRPELPLVEEDLAAGFLDQTRRPGLRHPGAVDLALLEQVQRVRVRGRQHLDVAAALFCAEAVVQQVLAQRDVLRVAELRPGDPLAVEVAGLLDAASGRTISSAPPLVAPATMRSASPSDCA